MSDNKQTVSRKLPIWVLAPIEEREARLNLKKFAYDECREYVKEMVDCSKVNGLRVFPTCNPQKKKMADCLLFYQTDSKYLDAERDKIVEKKIEIYEQQLKNSKEKLPKTP
ncbi:Cmc1p Ecym_6096 [Eremothecium cymbalariae DBVPG|uniref:COX assembly mitochondrial protein n=1 Tax=Eremothecium cymbalariae (strain CBS 270.75 / DBVPG 7215 / KCTC 17166 / NRRL Y-17582) TaxID=931890 RepID=G8JV13_ERECY|nr:hypothetical protein Ecym_6096 [Eremothecium cymbalariae DBVPG\